MRDQDIFKKHGKYFSHRDFQNPDNERLYDAYICGRDAAEEELGEDINPYMKIDWRYDAWLYGFRNTT